MNESQYRELNELRTYLNVKQKQKLANKLKIQELRKTITATKAEKLEALNERRRYMIMDKELRSLHEITNQKDWTLKVKELTKESEEEIQTELQGLEDQVEQLQDEVDILRIRISDTEWELTLKRDYYSHTPHLLGDLTTPIKG